MLEIHEKSGTEGYESVVDGIGEGNIHIVESLNGSEVNGYGVYSTNDEEISVYDFSSDEWDITDGIIRTILFKGMLGGINRCDFKIYDNDKMQKLIKLGFISEDRLVIEDINDFMSGCKNCEKK